MGQLHLQSKWIQINNIQMMLKYFNPDYSGRMVVEILTSHLIDSISALSMNLPIN